MRQLPIVLISLVTATSLSAQVSINPNTVKAVQASQAKPQTANTASGAGRSDAMIGELQTQIDQLRNELKATKSQLASANAKIASLQSGTDAVKIEVLKTKGDLAKTNGALLALQSDFAGHSHQAMFASMLGDKQKLQMSPTTPPMLYCKTKPASELQGGIPKTQSDYNCTNPYAAAK